MAVNKHSSGGGRNEADYHVKGGSLAGAIRSKEADDFASLDVNIDAIHDWPLAIYFNQTLGANLCGGSHAHGCLGLGTAAGADFFS